MNLNTLIDYISDRFSREDYLQTISKAKGFLLHSDKRLGYLQSNLGGSGYQHSAMPLLDITFRESIVAIVQLDDKRKEILTGRFVVYQEEIWLAEGKKDLNGLQKFPLTVVSRLEFEHPSPENLQRGRVSDFLDRI